MILPESWRELSPILFTLAWTTSQMFELVGDRRALAEELASLHGIRSVPRMANRDQEQPLKAKAMAVGRDLAEGENNHWQVFRLNNG